MKIVTSGRGGASLSRSVHRPVSERNMIYLSWANFLRKSIDLAARAKIGIIIISYTNLPRSLGKSSDSREMSSSSGRNCLACTWNFHHRHRHHRYHHHTDCGSSWHFTWVRKNLRILCLLPHLENGNNREQLTNTREYPAPQLPTGDREKKLSIPTSPAYMCVRSGGVQPGGLGLLQCRHLGFPLAATELTTSHYLLHFMRVLPLSVLHGWCTGRNWSREASIWPTSSVRKKACSCWEGGLLCGHILSAQFMIEAQYFVLYCKEIRFCLCKGNKHSSGYKSYGFVTGWFYFRHEEFSL